MEFVEFCKKPFVADIHISNTDRKPVRIITPAEQTKEYEDISLKTAVTIIAKKANDGEAKEITELISSEPDYVIIANNREYGVGVCKVQEQEQGQENEHKQEYGQEQKKETGKEKDCRNTKLLEVAETVLAENEQECTYVEIILLKYKERFRFLNLFKNTNPFETFKGHKTKYTEDKDELRKINTEFKLSMSSFVESAKALSRIIKEFDVFYKGKEQVCDSDAERSFELFEERLFELVKSDNGVDISELVSKCDSDFKKAHTKNSFYVFYFDLKGKYAFVECPVLDYLKNYFKEKVFHERKYNSKSLKKILEDTLCDYIFSRVFEKKYHLNTYNSHNPCNPQNIFNSFKDSEKIPPQHATLEIKHVGEDMNNVKEFLSLYHTLLLSKILDKMSDSYPLDLDEIVGCVDEIKENEKTEHFCTIARLLLSRLSKADSLGNINNGLFGV